MKNNSREPAQTARKIRLLKRVGSDMPWERGVFAEAGVHEVAWENPYGAISVRASDGSLLGIKPSEFEWVREPAQTAKPRICLCSCSKCMPGFHGSAKPVRPLAGTHCCGPQCSLSEGDIL